MFKKVYRKIRELTTAEIHLRDNFLIKYLEFIPREVKPNHITTLRFALAWLFFFPRFISAGPALFLAVSGTLTDIIDGVLARKRNQITDFGKIFDPMTDKILVAGILWYLFAHNLIGLNLIVHIILPETLLIVYGIWLLKNKWAKIPEPNILGRTKFVLYALGFIFLLISQLNNLDSALSNFGFLLITLGIIFAWLSQIVAVQEIIESIRLRARIEINKR